MRIRIVNQYAYTPGHSSGHRNFFMSRELVRRGHQVLIVSTSFAHQIRQETRLAPGEQWKQETVEGVRFHWLRTPSYQASGIARFWSMLVFGSRASREIGLEDEPKPDVVIGSSPHPFAALAARTVARKHRVPFVLELRDLWPDNLVDMGLIHRNHPASICFSRIGNSLIRSADAIITAMPISPAAMDKLHYYLESRGADPEKIHWLPNGVRMEEFPETTGVVHTQAPEKPMELLFLGSHSPYSDLDTVLSAAWVLQRDNWQDRITLRLVGDGPEKPRLVRRAKELGLTMVRFEDPVSQKKQHSLLYEVDACLISFCESGICSWASSPNKLFSYMAAGKPVISGMGKNYSPVEKAGAGFTCNAGDPYALADTIKDLYQLSPGERAVMGQNGRRYVTEFHDMEYLGGVLENVLNKL